MPEMVAQPDHRRQTEAIPTPVSSTSDLRRVNPSNDQPIHCTNRASSHASAPARDTNDHNDDYESTASRLTSPDWGEPHRTPGHELLWKPQESTKEGRNCNQKLRQGLQSEERDQYSYSPIGKQQTRLVLLKPGYPDEEIYAKLTVVDDTDLGSESFAYSALSYVWGSAPASHTVYIQDDIDESSSSTYNKETQAECRSRTLQTKALAIRPNLHDALIHLRSRKIIVPIWIDALCIDQNDAQERSNQVQKMGSIYMNAQFVSVWLGTNEDSAIPAFRLARELTDMHALGDTPRDSRPSVQWDSLSRLTHHAWFTRAWVVQEVVFARRVTFHCGGESIAWDDLQDAIGIFNKYFHHIPLGVYATKHGRRRVLKPKPLAADLLVSLCSNIFRRTPAISHESTIGLETLVSLAAMCDTSDPRDKVYALLGIAKEFNNAGHPDAHAYANGLPPRVDYTKDLFQVYRDFLKWVIQRSNGLDILCRYWALPERLHESPTTPRLVDLPSWILTVDNSPSRRDPGIFGGPKAAESLVGLPGKAAYSASSRRLPVYCFGTGQVSSAEAEGLHGYGRPKSGFTSDGLYHDMSLTIDGIVIGVVDWFADLPDGAISRQCLQKLGWQPLEKPTWRNPNPEPPKVPDQVWRTLIADRDTDGASPPSYFRRACQSCLTKYAPNGHLNTKEVLESDEFHDQNSPAQDYLRRVLAVCYNRVCFTANTPYGSRGRLVGLAPAEAQENDVIAILYGCSVPVVLRKQQSTLLEKESFAFVGEAFVYGQMDGEAMFDTKVEKSFRLT